MAGSDVLLSAPRDSSPQFQVRAYSHPHEAHLACSALQAAGIHATVADEHVVSAIWPYSNAVGGVKVFVRAEDAAAAEAVLGVPAEVEEDAAAGRDTGDLAADTQCPRCGSFDVVPAVFGRRLAFLTWLVAGVPLFPVLRRSKCRACGYRFRDAQGKTARHV